MTYEYHVSLICLYEERKWEKHDMLISFPYFMSQNEMTDVFEQVVEDIPHDKFLDFEAFCERLQDKTGASILAKDQFQTPQPVQKYEIKLYW